MARILFAWELGEGLGHIHCLLPIALRMRSLGHDCVFAVHNIYTSHAVLGQHGFPILQAPLVSVSTGTGRTWTIADILMDAGFDRLDRLWPLLASWDAIVASVQPDLIVGDYTPGLCLAMRGGDVPVAIVGNGFTLPPDTDAFPLLVDDQPPTALPDSLLGTINDVQSRRGKAPLTRPPEIFTAQARFVTTLRVLDRHDGLRTEAARVGPPRGVPPPAEALPEADYFAYLAVNWPPTATILDGLVKSGMTGSVYLREASPKQIATYREKGLVIHESPRETDTEVANAAVLVHHGGLGTLEVGLASGRPQLLFPRYLEQHVNATTVGRLGVSLRTQLRSSFSVDQVAGGLARLRREAGYAARAKQQAQRIAESGDAGGVDGIVPVLQGLLGASASTGTRGLVPGAAA